MISQWFGVGGVTHARRLTIAGLLGLAGVGSAPIDALAQAAFRSADPGRPIRVEDAQAMELREWEIEFGSKGSLVEGAGDGAHGVLEVKAGLFRNVQLGVGVESAIQQTGPGTVTGIEAFETHLLLGLRRETPGGPALAIRAGASTPGAGSLGRADPEATLTGILTRSAGRLRVHANGGYTWASDVDGGSFWLAGVGGDYPVGFLSRSLLADLYVEFPDIGDPRIWVDAGSRIQLSKKTVLDVGLATRIDRWSDGVSNLEIVLGFSRIFGLTPTVETYRQPTLR